MDSKLHMLIVEGDAATSEQLERILVREGHLVTVADDGSRALDLLKEESFDVVLTDMKLPPLGGAELIRTVRRETPGAGIILIAACDDVHSVKDGLLLGVNDYVTRPFKSNEVSLVVERVRWKVESNRRHQSGTGLAE